jgi:hypothetical protein
MSLQVAELFATLGLDAKDMDRTLDRSLRDARRSVARGMSDAAKAGGDELADGLEAGAEDSIDAVVKVLKGAESDVDRAGERMGGAIAAGIEEGVREADGVIDAEMLGGTPGEFRREGDQLGSALADGIDQGVRSTSAKVDPSSLGASPSEFRNEGEKLGDAFSDGVAGGVDSGPADDAVGGFLDSLPEAMTSPATAAGAAIAGAFIIGMEEAFADESTSKRLGASLSIDFGGTDYEAVGTTISNLMAGGWERGQAAAAVEAVFSSLEESQGSQNALENLTNQALAFSEVFGTDIATSVELARTLISEGLAKDGTEAFDLLSQAMADTPLYNRDELTEAVREYSQYFAGIGLDGPQAMAILAQAAEGGSYVIDKTGDSVKEFGIIMRDMPDAARAALEDMGINVDDVRAKIAEGGPAAEEAFGQIITAIQGIEDPLARSQAAVALFGVPFEDVAGNTERMDQVLRSLATGGMAEFEGASARNVEAMNTADAKVQGYLNTAKGFLGDYVGGAVLIVGDAFSTNIAQFDAFRESGARMWRSMTEDAGAMALNVAVWLGGMVDTVQSLPGRIAAAASGMFDGIKAAFRSALQGIANGWNNLSFPSFSIPSIDTPFGTIGGGRTPRIDLPDISIPAFHTGGILPGPSGKEALFLGLGGEMVLTEDQQASINAALNADLSAAVLGSGSAAAAAGGSSVPMAEVGILANQVAALTREVARKGDNITIAGVSDPMRAVRHLGREKRARAWARGVG